jgi:hypothetical protein
VEAGIASGQFKSLPWVAAVAVALLHLRREDREPNG